MSKGVEHPSGRLPVALSGTVLHSLPGTVGSGGVVVVKWVVQHDDVHDRVFAAEMCSWIRRYPPNCQIDFVVAAKKFHRNTDGRNLACC